jgi:hypothetical protein
MEIAKKNWKNNPSKKNLVLFTGLWFLGITLLILSTTDLFKESFFQKKNLMIFLLIIGSTVATAKLHFKYWKIKIT